MKPQLIAKLDIKIEQDWDQLRQLTIVEQSKMQEAVEANDYLHKEYSDEYRVSYMGPLSKGWTQHSGLSMMNHMPWHEKFLKIIEPLQCDGLILSINTKSISEHVDFLECYLATEKHNLVPDGKCKINYIISSSDPNAVTTVTDRDDPTHIKQYTSEPNVAWLLDTNHPHSVKLDGYREVITFFFCEKFETVLEHFERLGPLTLR